MANAAWLALAVIAHNLSRAVGCLAGASLEKATTATLQRVILTVPGRLRAQRPTATSTTTHFLTLGTRHQTSAL